MLMIEQSVKDVVVTDENEAMKTLEKKILSAMKRYLSSSNFEDIGPIISERLVDFFGMRTAETIATSPEHLLSVHGIGKKRLLFIKNGWTLQSKLLLASTEFAKLKKQK